MRAQEWSALEPFKELRLFHTHSTWVEQISAVAIYVSGFIDIWKLTIKQKLHSDFCGQLKIWSKTFPLIGYLPLLLLFMPFHFSRAA